jgi:uncharacterized protein (DUF1499 family)
MIVAWLAYFDALVAVALVLAGVVAAHFGISTPFFGFELFAAGLLFGALALFLAIIALLTLLFSPSRRSALPRAAVSGVLGLIVIVPALAMVLTHPYPPINDITTDTRNPPEFVHAQELTANRGRSMKYDATTYAPVQENAAAYHDLAPLKLDTPPDQAYKKAKLVAAGFPSWEITSQDPQTRTIEGVATSSLFHFHDDFVIEVRPADGGGSLVEMRSKSRDGKGDLGANYNRIKTFFHLLQGPPSDMPPMN